MWLVCGLGNPGEKYAGTRHNIGFMVADEIADRTRAGAFASKFKGEFVSTNLGTERCGLLKPLTYMNVSGDAVQPAAAFFKVPPEQVIVIHDDLDLPLGELKLKKGGGHGGHNGLRSITQRMGPEFVRVRAGIGRPDGKRDVSNFVLGNFQGAETEEAQILVKRCADAVEMVIKDGLLAAQQTFHTKNKKKKKPKKPAPDGDSAAEG